MNEFVYKEFYDRCGTLQGWDFSKVRSISEGVKWDFYDEVSQNCEKSDILLDIGTGGGEALLSIAEAALLVVGIDISDDMVAAATANAATSRNSNVRFMQMDSDILEFPDGFFDIVSSRQAPIRVSEVARVLADGGVFLTQQVSEEDKRNIKQVFGRGQSYGIKDGMLQRKYVSELHEAGFREVQAFEYDATEYYQSYEDIIFLLKHTPIVPNFGESDNDFVLLEKFMKAYQSEKGIMTNSKRFMIIARK